MDRNEAKARVAAALAVKLAVSRESAMAVADTTLRALSECGLIVVSASELAQVNHIASSCLETVVELLAQMPDDYEIPSDVRAMVEKITNPVPV